jgi:hypothetical protein
MRIPQQVPERVKEAPAQALRAVFSVIGQVLLVADRIKNRGAEPERARPVAAAPSAQSSSGQAAPATTAEPPAAEPPTGQTVMESAATEAVAQSPATEQAALPVPNYDDLTVASLRARLRNLDQSQVRMLLDYEKAHAGRADVLTMFERRITKLDSDGA